MCRSLTASLRTPNHCSVSKFVAFGIGSFPLGIVHIEAKTNLAGPISHNGTATTLITKNQPKDAALLALGTARLLARRLENRHSEHVNRTLRAPRAAQPRR